MAVDKVKAEYRYEKVDFIGRLKAEGRWREFLMFRENLKDHGVPADEAWKMGMAEFAPIIKPSEKVYPEITARNKAEGELGLLKHNRLPTAKVVAWVWEHLDDQAVGPADAPSGSAWALLIWASKSDETRGEFFKTFVSKMMPNRQQIEDAEKYHDDGGEVSEFLAELKADATAFDGLRLGEECLAKAVEHLKTLPQTEHVASAVTYAQKAVTRLKQEVGE